MTESNVDPESIHLTLDRNELLLVINALRSVGNVELTQRLETILRQAGGSTEEHWWRT